MTQADILPENSRRMLSGTPNKGKDGNEIIDGLEELFKECKDYEEVWTKLTEDNCPIVFYYLDLLGLNLSDDLYIKMNARGEQLTSFENFKADLVGYIKRQSESTVSVEDEKKWKGFLNPTEGIPIKMDTTWTDIFWKNKTEDGKIDEIYFAFLNRFFLNEFICKKKKDYVAAEIIAGDPIFKLLYGDKSDDSQILYQSFEKYKDCITIETLTSLKNTLDNFADFVKGEQLDEIDKLFLPTWDDTLDFSFIPKYRDKSITTLTQPQRVVFYAICKYFEKGKYDEPSFRQWMRVIWNLVENGNINTIDSMVANIRLINELSKYSHKIYEFLAKDEINSDTNKEQLREEIKKAKKISENNLWEEKIITAEKNKILKGKIWVLFQNEDSTELPTFNERLSLLQNIQDSEDAWFLQKILISYSGRLTKKVNLSMPNLKILLTKDLSLSFKSIPSTNPALINMEMTENWQKDIATTPLLDHSRGKILSPDKERFVLWGTDGCKWKSFGNDIYGNVILANPRNAILSALYEKVEKGKTLSEGKITSSQKIDGCDFFWGWDINFKYKLCGQEYFFRWQSSDQIDMYERNDYKQLLAHFTYAAQSLIDEMNHCIETYNQLQTQSNASKS